LDPIPEEALMGLEIFYAFLRAINANVNNLISSSGEKVDLSNIFLSKRGV
jgi:hypothetical protein